MEEWLDIVDESDTVIGRAPRHRIHAEGHYHRSSHIMLFNSRDQVFVQLRSMNKDNGAGLWDSSAAGHVDSGESYLDCAVRELHEELGIVVTPQTLELVGRLEPDEGNGFEFSNVFTLCSEQHLVLQAEEVDDGRWLTPKELDQWIQERRADFTQVFLAVWKIVCADPSLQR
jgi:isopentenyl-diphosphate delta-isomerase